MKYDNYRRQTEIFRRTFCFLILHSRIRGQDSLNVSIYHNTWWDNSNDDKHHIHCPKKFQVSVKRTCIKLSYYKHIGELTGNMALH
jgi:hypothetical protein